MTLSKVDGSKKTFGVTGTLAFDFELFIGALCQKQRADIVSICQLLSIYRIVNTCHGLKARL